MVWGYIYNKEYNRSIEHVLPSADYVDDLLEDSDRVKHRAITEFQIAIHKAFTDWEKKAQKWADEQIVRGRNKQEVTSTYNHNLEEVWNDLRVQRDDFIMQQEQIQSDRDLAIIQHFS